MSKPRNHVDGEGAVATPSLTRWTELSSGGPSSSPDDDDIERRIGILFEKVPAPPLLGHAAYGRVAARLLDPPGRERAISSSWFGRLAMGSGLGMFALLISGGVIAAGGVGAWWKMAHPRAPAPQAVAMAGGEAGGGVRRRARARADRATAFPPNLPPAAAEPVPAVESPPPELSPDIAPSPAAPPRPALLARPRAAAAAAPPVSPRAGVPEPESTELAQEIRLLGKALAELRQQHDGAGALGTLNDYLGRFPNGTLRGEAQRARVDALLLLGRRDEARRALDRLDLEPVGRGQELMLIRGELRAQRHCAGAIADFDVVLGQAAPPPLAERALFGRAVCRHQEGQRRAAREDAVAYLERFPAGKFASAARRLVAAAETAPAQAGPSEGR